MQANHVALWTYVRETCKVLSGIELPESIPQESAPLIADFLDRRDLGKGVLFVYYDQRLQLRVENTITGVPASVRIQQSLNGTVNESKAAENGSADPDNPPLADAAKAMVPLEASIYFFVNANPEEADLRKKV